MTAPPQLTLPLAAQGVVYFVDEAGSKGSSGSYFVTAAVRTTDPDLLARTIKAERERRRFTNAEELKFSKVTKTSQPILSEIFRQAVHLGCTFGGFVLDKRHFDPWSNRHQWEGHLFATERLLRGVITRREVAVALLDHIDVPTGVSYGEALMANVNNRFGNKRIVAAVSLDSRTCPGLQIADLLASAIYYARRKIEEHGREEFLASRTPKARLSRDIADALGTSDFADCDSRILRLKTSHEESLRELRAAGRIKAGAGAIASG